MKQKLCRIAAVVLTTILTLLLLSISSMALNYRYNHHENGAVPRKFYKEKMDYDVIFLGSSHAGCGIYPLQLWNDYGISSYNLAGSAMMIPSSFHIFKNAIQYHKPKVAVLDTFYANTNSLVSDQLDSLHYSFDVVPLSRQKLESLKELFPDVNQRTAYIIPFSLFHNRWSEVTLEGCWDSVFHLKVDRFKGAWFPSNVVPTLHPPKTDECLSEDTAGLEYIRNFISLCKQNNIQPVLITVPFPATLDDQRGENSVHKLAAELENVPYYNFNRLDLIDFDTDLTDGNGHVNFSGGRKVTDYIGRFLRESYNVPDRRGNSAYGSWNEDYEAFRQRLFAIMRGKTDLKSSLMLCNNSNFSARLSIKECAALDGIEQKLVAQLGDAIVTEYFPAGAVTEAGHDVRLTVSDTATGNVVSVKNWDCPSSSSSGLVFAH